MGSDSKIPQAIQLKFENEQLKLELEILKENVRFAQEMQKKAYASLGLATKKLDTDLCYTAQERKMKRNVIYKRYFDVCDAIITLCKPEPLPTE